MENNFNILCSVHKVANQEFRNNIPNPEETFNSIIEKGNLYGTNDYQHRETDATQAAVSATMNALFDPMNGHLYNQFIDVLINRIGMVKIRKNEWSNPLAAFKGERLNYGSTIQEIATKWVKAHSYDDEAETLLKMRRPEVEQCFHSVNREDKYEITIVDDELRMAFTQEFGLNELVSSLIQNVFNSDNYDEYRAMLNILAEYEERWGFFKHHLDSAPVDETSGKKFLKAVRELTGKLAFPSTKYNARIIEDIPVFARPDELVLFYTPQAAANISVDVLASLFNVEKAQLEIKTVLVDEFPIPNAFALLTTKDWFVCHDKVYQMTSFYNPENLARNNFLHHWQVLSASPFVPAILFTTEDGTLLPTFEQEVTGLNLNAEKSIANPGDVVQLFPQLLGTFDGRNGVAPATACTYELHYEGQTGKNSRTFVDRKGALHIQKNAVIGDVLIVDATSTYRNPSTGEDDIFTAQVRIYIGQAPAPDEKYYKNPISALSATDEFNRNLELSMDFVGYRDANETQVNRHIPIFKVENAKKIFHDGTDTTITFAFKDEAVAEEVQFKLGSAVKTSPFVYDPASDGYSFTATCIAEDFEGTNYACDLQFVLAHEERIIPTLTSAKFTEVDGTTEHNCIIPEEVTQGLNVSSYENAVEDRFDLYVDASVAPVGTEGVKLYWKNDDIDWREVDGSEQYLSTDGYNFYLMAVIPSQGVGLDIDNWVAYKFEKPEMNYIEIRYNNDVLLYKYDGLDESITDFASLIASSFNPASGAGHLTAAGQTLPKNVYVVYTGNDTLVFPNKSFTTGTGIVTTDLIESGKTYYVNKEYTTENEKTKKETKKCTIKKASKKAVKKTRAKK